MNIEELQSFKLSDAVKFHDTLNPKLFKEGKIDPVVRDQLLLIAEDFITELGIKALDVDDVTISGSNAAYTYTKHSDLDLHILVDMSKLPHDEIYRELFTAKKTIYNDSHDITVRGIPVELYVQDSNEPVKSLGEYSILRNEWLRFPSKRRANFDQNATQAKYEKLGDMLELAYRAKNYKKLLKVLDILKRYRKAGLEKGGEFGPENLAFKALRKQGIIKALYDLKDALHSRELSIEDYDPNGPPPGPEFKPTMPKGTVRVDVSDVYDWYKLGQHISNLKGLGKHDFGKGPPSTILSFGDEDLEHEYIKDLEKTGLSTTDIDPVDPNQPKGMKRQKVDPTYNVNEEQYTFAGKDPMSFKSPKGGTPTMLLVTGQGSRYLVTSDGMVLRNKSFHASTGGEDQGLKDWSGAIEFYDPSEKPGGAPFALTVSKAVEKKLPVALSNTKDGKRALLIYDGKQWRVAKVSDIYKNVASTDDPIVATYSKTPKLNWNVFDYDVDTNNKIVKAHPGSPVTHGVKLAPSSQIAEVSGYIPSNAEKNDPRFKTALTVDIESDTMKQNAKKLGWNISRAGIPPLLRK